MLFAVCCFVVLMRLEENDSLLADSFDVVATLLDYEWLRVITAVACLDGSSQFSE